MADESKASGTEPETLPKAYDAAEVESRWYSRWEDAGLFRADPGRVGPDREAYVIMMPPPNVTGTLHNGHALFVTLQDILTRYYRMNGREALWLPGVDHAGIATQAVVERELKRHEGKTRHDVGREAFLERVWAWKEKNGSRIVEQMKVLGASADWSRNRFTMDEQCNRAVREAFVRMWDDGLIFRGERLVNWDPVTRTAISDEEVEYEERSGELWSFAYPVKGGDGEIVVATTRPETMLGDTAVAVHPEDDRYRELVGKELEHPFFPNRSVRVVADDYVDREFGTGAVKITPAHDPNDFELGNRHALERINILNEDGTLNENGGEFAGQDRYEARKAVKRALEERGLARGTKAITHQVSISQRSGEAIEPMLSRQYFVNAKPLAEKAIAAVESGETRILPESWRKTWDHFLHNIRDWCISRQLWWGHRIPVFYDLEQLDAVIDEDAKRKGTETEPSRARAAGAGKEELLRLVLSRADEQLVRSMSRASTQNLAEQEPGKWLQEEDVLDTWFSSGLWPFSTLGWPEETEDLAKFYPGAVLETGFDIIFFWVARMMMMGTHFMGRAPFADVYLHAMVRDSHGKKMSKSQGNAIDPLDVVYGITLDDLIAKVKTYPVPEKKLPKVIEGLKKEYPEGIPESGADGLRFSLAALASQGNDVKLAIGRVAGYRAFLNKIWNATRFALMRVGTEPVKPLAEVRGDLSLADRWVLSELQTTIAKSRTAVETYRFDDLAHVVYHFFWSDFCDWYIELAKGPLSDDADPKEREAARSCLLHVLDAAMRLLQPICPFQSEEIWQKLPGREQRWGADGPAFCMVAPYPEVDDTLRDRDAEAAMELLQGAVQMARNARQESGIPVTKRIPAVYLVDAPERLSVLEANRDALVRLAQLDSCEVRARDGYDVPKHAAVNADAHVQVVVPLEGLIDLDAERQRLEKALAKAEKEHGSLAKRMQNEKFLSKAPAEVVAQGKADLAAAEEKLSKLRAAIARVSQ